MLKSLFFLVGGVNGYARKRESGLSMGEESQKKELRSGDNRRNSCVERGLEGGGLVFSGISAGLPGFFDLVKQFLKTVWTVSVCQFCANILGKVMLNGNPAIIPFTYGFA